MEEVRAKEEGSEYTGIKVDNFDGDNCSKEESEITRLEKTRRELEKAILQLNLAKAGI